MAAIFHDPSLEEEFRRQGFVRVPLLAPGEIAQLQAAFDRLGDPMAGFFCSVQGLTPQARRFIFEQIEAAFRPHLIRLLRNYRMCVASFMSKASADPNSRLAMHQDWSFADEPESRAVHFWSPLCDVELDNGCLALTPGSHHLCLPRRSYADQSRIAGVLPLLVERYTLELPMSAGEAVLFDGGLVHGSRPNTRPQVRVAASAICTPADEPVLHCVRTAPETLEVFEVDAEFFWDYEIGERPRRVKSRGSMAYESQPLTEADILASPHLTPVASPAAPGLEILV